MLKYYGVNGGQKQVRSDQFVGFEICRILNSNQEKNDNHSTYFVKAELRNGKKCDILDLFDDEETAKNEMCKFSAQIEEDLKA